MSAFSTLTNENSVTLSHTNPPCSSLSMATMTQNVQRGGLGPLARTLSFQIPVMLTPLEISNIGTINPSALSEGNVDIHIHALISGGGGNNSSSNAEPNPGFRDRPRRSQPRDSSSQSEHPEPRNSSPPRQMEESPLERRASEESSLEEEDIEEESEPRGMPPDSLLQGARGPRPQNLGSLERDVSPGTGEEFFDCFENLEELLSAQENPK